MNIIIYQNIKTLKLILLEKKSCEKKSNKYTTSLIFIHIPNIFSIVRRTL